MNITIEPIEETESLRFPCLMIFETKEHTTIILAQGQLEDGRYIGGCLYTTHKDNNTGDWSDNWSRLFKPYYGRVILEN